jgi:hypothetical protein
VTERSIGPLSVPVGPNERAIWPGRRRCRDVAARFYADAALQRRFAALDCALRQRPATERDAPAQDAVAACGADGSASSPPAEYLLGPTAVEGARVSSARAVRDQQAGGRRVRLGGGTADISGRFTRESAWQLVVTLGPGALPAPLTVAGVTRLPHGQPVTYDGP